MTATPSAFTVKTGILSPPNAESHAPNVTIGSTTCMDVDSNDDEAVHDSSQSVS